MATGETKREANRKDLKFIELGYKVAILLSLLGLLFSAAYLFVYLFKSHPELIRQDTMSGFSAERRMVLLSTAIFVGMSFGFLGFALFLIQAKGEIEGSFSYQGFKIDITRMSPGLFVILCATIIIIYSATFRIEYSVQPATQTPHTDSTAQKDTGQYRINTTLPDPDDTLSQSTSRYEDSLLKSKR